MNCLDLPRTIRPGQRLRGVRQLKRALKQHMTTPEQRRLAAKMDLESSTYGGVAVRCVQMVQRARGLTANGVVGPNVWKALGQEQHLAPVSLRGIPWPGPGFRSWNGCWVPTYLFDRLVQAKHNGWSGDPYSVHRPDWYQKSLYDAAVIKYGPTVAGKWVAPPGQSNHRYPDWRCAVDATRAEELRSIDPRWYQPMTWEPWHCQWKAAYPIRALRALRSALSPNASEEIVAPPEGVDWGAVEAFIVSELDKIDIAILEGRGE